jgi:hypothetical protein
MSEMDSWLTQARDAVADAAAVDAGQLELTGADMGTLLDIARIAAHESGERTNAPLLCYLLGLARHSGTDLETLAGAVRRSTS